MDTPLFDDPAATVETCGYEIATCNYTAWRLPMGVPVRTTTGYPRFWKGPKLAVSRLLSPFGVFGEPGMEDEDRYRGAYLQRLDDNVDQIRDELAALRDEHDHQPLVLLCFDKLAKPGVWCHRTMAAEWLADRCSLIVPELEPRH